jgi:tetratricopeptide (TPR) repeat protein
VAQGLAGGPTEAAARDYREAQRLFGAGEYRQALRLFESAYEAVPTAETLYGAGLCFEALGNYTRAVEVYESLLQDHPSYSDRESVEHALAELREHIADVEAVDIVSGGDVVGNAGWVHEESQTDVRPQAMRMTRGRKASWGLLSSGLAIAAVGAGLLIRGAVLHREFEETKRAFFKSDEAGCSAANRDMKRMAETGETLFESGWGLTISGLAISCASVLLFILIAGEEAIPSELGSRVNARLSLTGMSFAGSF